MGTQHLVLFRGTDANNNRQLWETDGTAAGTWEMPVPAGMSVSSNQTGLVTIDDKVYFATTDGLWVTDGTTPGTSKILISGVDPNFGLSPSYLTAFGNKLIFRGADANSHHGLWVSDGTAPGTVELHPVGAGNGGLLALAIDPGFTVFGNEVLFIGENASGKTGLWVTDGTDLGTHEIAPIQNVNSQGLVAFTPPEPNFAVVGNQVVFSGDATLGLASLWVTDGMAADTHVLVSDIRPDHLTTFGNKALFNAQIQINTPFPHFVSTLWVTDGTAAGTHDIPVTGTAGLNPSNFIVLGNEALFEGEDAKNQRGLWITDGTSASEITVNGASASGLFNNASGPNFAVLGNEVLFNGTDGNGLTGLWMTDGTSLGTHEVMSGAAAGFPSGLNPTNLTSFAQTLVRPALSNVPANDLFTPHGAAVTLALSAHVSDTNSPALVSATVAITGGKFANDGDMLSAVTTGTGILASYDTASETLTLTGTDTLANYQRVLQSVTFSNSSSDPTNSTLNTVRTIAWTVDDGNASNNVSAPVTTTLKAAGVNAAPILSGVPAAASYAEGGNPTVLAPAATVSDVDDSTLLGAQISITSGFLPGDVLSASTAGTGIIANYAPTGQLFLFGVDTLAHFQQVIDSVTFSAGANPTNFGTDTTRTITWSVDDGHASNNLSALQTTTLTVIGINHPPMFGGSGDYDGDNDKNGDVLWQNADGSVVAWDMNGPQLASTQTLGSMPSNWHLVGTGHFSGGNVNTDALFHSDTGGVVVWQTSGGTVSANQFLGQIPSNWHFAGVGDVNGDGNSDVFWHSDSGAVVVWEMNGAHVALDQQVGNVPSNWHFAGTGDVNGDGKSDVLWQSDTGGIVLWEMNGTQVQEDQFLGQVPANWHFAAIGDFNGDGKADILFHSDAGAVVMWELNGTQILANQVVGQVAPNWHISGTADVNGDGKSDVIWTSDTGAHLVWEMNGTQVIADQPIGPNALPASPPLNAQAAAATVAHDPHILV